MRVLLDESVPRRFGFLLEGHFVRTVQQQGWSGLKNGVLLATASPLFDVLVTADKNMCYQQNPAGLAMTVVALAAHNNRLETLAELVPRLLSLLEEPLDKVFMCLEISGAG